MNSPSGSGDERPEDLELRFRILSAEYSALIFHLGSTWSVSAARTNLFFVALSAAGVWTMTNLPAASMATLVALVNTFVTGAIAGTAYLSLGGNPSAALVWAAA